MSNVKKRGKDTVMTSPTAPGSTSHQSPCLQSVSPQCAIPNETSQLVHEKPSGPAAESEGMDQELCFCRTISALSLAHAAALLSNGRPMQSVRRAQRAFTRAASIKSKDAPGSIIISPVALYTDATLHRPDLQMSLTHSFLWTSQVQECATSHIGQAQTNQIQYETSKQHGTG